MLYVGIAHSKMSPLVKRYCPSFTGPVCTFDFSALKFVRGFVKNFEKVYVHQKVSFLCGMYPTQIHIPNYSTLQILLKREMCGNTKKCPRELNILCLYVTPDTNTEQCDLGINQFVDHKLHLS